MKRSACGGFAAERSVGWRYRSTAADSGLPAATAPQHGAQQQIRGQCNVDSRVDEAERRLVFTSAMNYACVYFPAAELYRPGARFTKYLTTILRLSYDNAKVTIDLRRTSNLQNVLRRTQGFSEARFNCKVVRSSETVFAN